MYDRRFEQWGVKKYLKQATKEEYLKILTQTGAWSGETPPNRERHITLSVSDRAKVERYVKSKSRISKTTSPKARKRSTRSISNVVSTDFHTLVEVSSTLAEPLADSDLKLSPGIVLTRSSSCAASRGAESDDCTTMDKANSDVSDVDDNPEDWVLMNQRAVMAIHGSPQSTGLTYDVLQLISQQWIPRSPGRRMQLFQGDLLFGSITQFVDSLTLNLEGLAPQRSMWSELSNGIYLHKVESPTLAWKTLHHACDIAWRELSTARAFDFEFLLKLFSTLSAINARACPDVRRLIIQYLRHLASMRLPDAHPVHTICHELQRDDQDETVSERALLCMLDKCSTAAGNTLLSRSQSSRLEAISFMVEKALIALLRRDGQLDAALSRSERLHRKWQERLLSCVNQVDTLGVDPGELDDWLPVALHYNNILKHARAAATQLAHVYMAVRSDDAYWAAINLCYFRMYGRPDCAETETGLAQPDQSLNATAMGVGRQLLQDVDSVYALEDLSKIQSELGRHDLSLYHLTRAVQLAKLISSDAETNTVLEHVTDKLVSMHTGTRVAV